MLEPVRPVIICEVLDWVTVAWGCHASQIGKRWGSLDYQWFDFCEDGALPVHVKRDEYQEVRNYLAVPREKLPQISSWRRA